MFSGQGYPVTAMALDDSDAIAIDRARPTRRSLRPRGGSTWPLIRVREREG